jgi:hypothetical protein
MAISGPYPLSSRYKHFQMTEIALFWSLYHNLSNNLFPYVPNLLQKLRFSALFLLLTPLPSSPPFLLLKLKYSHYQYLP